MTIAGPKGTIKRSFQHAPIEIEKVSVEKGERIGVRMWFGKRKQRCVVGSVAGHIRNMIHGVKRGYKLTMKELYRHHPIKTVIGKTRTLDFSPTQSKDLKFLIISNYLGGRNKVTLEAPNRVSLTQIWQKDELLIHGINLEDVSNFGILLF